MRTKTPNLMISCLVAIALLFAMLPQAEAGAAKPDPGEKIEAALLAKVQANPGGRYNVIVSMEPGKQKGRGQSAKEARAAVEKEGGSHDKELKIVGGSSGSMNGEAILSLANNPKVAQITEDSPLSLLGTDVTTVSTLTVRAPDVWALGYTGKGVGVAILDSGVAPRNDLTSSKNRIIASVDMVSGTVGTTDLGGHGTHVAGIVAGNGKDSNGSRQGIAPDANIVSVKVTNDYGVATYSSVIGGVEWVVVNRKAYNIRVMNISLGGPVKGTYKNDPLAGALEVAWFSGIVVVVASGNSGPTSRTITAPANDPYVITVGAFDDYGTASRGDDKILDLSSRGPTAYDNLPKPDLVAPGRKVVSLRVPGSYLDQIYPDRVVDTDYFRMTGTSMSAPVVAGVAALMIEKNPRLSPNQVKYILMDKAKGISGSSNAVGKGSVDALDAVKSTSTNTANNGVRPNNLFAAAVYSIAKGSPLVWKDTKYLGRNWTNYTWDTLPWDNYTWDNFSWESWANYTWDNYTWDNFTWDNFTWDNYTWDNYTWDNYTWDNYAWDNFTWD